MSREYQVGQDFKLAGQEIKARRTAMGTSQAELAEQLAAAGLKLHATAISKIESGSRAATFVEIAWIAHILGIDIRAIAEVITNGLESDLVTTMKRARAKKLRAELAELEGGIA
jgi:transcriptional regulator with XRE-family HTH domain